MTRPVSAVRCSGLFDGLVGQQRRIEQAVGIVERRAEKLPSRQILVGRRHAALDLHCGRVERLRIAEARQRRAVGAQQEDRLDHVASRLADSECCEGTVVERGFGHDPVDGECQLRDDLVDPDRRQRAVAAAAVGKQAVGVFNGGLAPFDGNIHGVTSPLR